MDYSEVLIKLKYLEMKGISKSFPGVQALLDVSIDADEGEIIALLGENGAGKSTLMNILGGIVRCDEGAIMIANKEINIRSVSDAQKAGITFIHQELSLFKQLSVQENLFIEGFPRIEKTPFINQKVMQEKTEGIFREFGIDIPAKEKVSKLTMGQQQIVEIAGAVMKDAKIIILDEPSTSLTTKEREKLYNIVLKLRGEQKVIIYITHDIDNALELSDRVYVLRDGKNAGTGSSGEISREDVIRMMIGSKAGKTFFKSRKDIAKDRAVLKLTNISTAEKLKNVSLELRAGEVYGLYGLIGSGRTELIHAMYGLNKMTSGKIEINGQTIRKPTPKLLKKIGVGYLTENRRDEGLFLELSVSTNISITSLEKIKNNAGILSRKKEENVSEEVINLLNIATPSQVQLAGKLSGGNQQKVVLGKWLHLSPSIFIFDEPTKGIDVGAKSEIYRLIDEIACKGISIILISSEIEEILGVCDRVGVMTRGKLVAELEGDQINPEDVMRYTMS